MSGKSNCFGVLFIHYYFSKLAIEKVKTELRKVNLALCYKAPQVNFGA